MKALKPSEMEVVKVVAEIAATRGNIELSWDDPAIKDHIEILTKAKVRSTLVSEHSVSVSIDKTNRTVTLVGTGVATAPVTPAATPADDATTATSEPAPVPERVTPKSELKALHHTYIKPKLHNRMKKLIQSPSSLVVCGTGPTGCGKTHHMKLMAEELDMELFLINCRKDMESADFFGDKTVDIDKETAQNFVAFFEGKVVKAMTCGLDENGNEVGRPGLLVIDEFPVIPSWIAIGLNHLLENASARRKISLESDGGREVTSHSLFRIVLLGNTIGKGLSGIRDAQYTAQGDALDISTLDRIDAIFKYGYNRKAEESILREKIGNDRVIKQVLEFRDAIRAKIRLGEATTPFSTRLLVSFADLYREYDGDIAEALHDSVFTKLVDDSPDPSQPGGELHLYNEQAVAIFGVDVLATVGDDDMDYM